MGGAKVSDKILRHREPAAEGRPAADRRGDDLHVPEGAGARRSARAGSRPTSSTWPASCSSWPATSSSCPIDHLVADRPEAGAETKVVDGPGDPRRLVRHGHRPGDDRRVLRRDHPARPARSSGTARWASSRTSRSPRGPRAVAEAMADSPAVTAVGGGEIGRGRREVRLGRQGDARLHRRRRLPRVARGEIVQLAEGHPRPLSRQADVPVAATGRRAPSDSVTGAGGAPTKICLTSPKKPTGTPTKVAAAALTILLSPEVSQYSRGLENSGWRSTIPHRPVRRRCRSSSRRRHLRVPGVAHRRRRRDHGCRPLGPRALAAGDDPDRQRPAGR